MDIGDAEWGDMLDRVSRSFDELQSIDKSSGEILAKRRANKARFDAMDAREEAEKIAKKAAEYEGRGRLFEVQAIQRGLDSAHRKLGAVYGLLGLADEATMQEFYREDERVAEAFDMAMDMGDVNALRKFYINGMKTATDMLATSMTAAATGGIVGAPAMAGVYTIYGMDTLSREYQSARASGLSKGDSWQHGATMSAIELGTMAAFHGASKAFKFGDVDAQMAKIAKGAAAAAGSKSAAKDTGARVAAEAVSKFVTNDMKGKFRQLTGRPLVQGLLNGGGEVTEEVVTAMGQTMTRAAQIPGAENEANWYDENGEAWNSPMMNVLKHTAVDTMSAMMFLSGPGPVKNGVRRFLAKPSRTNAKAVEKLLIAAGAIKDKKELKTAEGRRRAHEVLLKQLRAGKLGAEVEALAKQYGVSADTLTSGWEISEATGVPEEFGPDAFEVLPGVVLGDPQGGTASAEVEQAERAVVEMHNKLAGEYGYKLRIADNDSGSGITGTDGIHFGANKTIWMTRRRVRLMSQGGLDLKREVQGLYLHELVHTTENTGTYQDLYDHVWENHRAQLNAARKEYADLAKAEGVTLTEAELKKEGLTRWMQLHLHKSGALHKMARTNTSLFERLSDWWHRNPLKFWANSKSYRDAFDLLRDAAVEAGLPPRPVATEEPANVSLTDFFLGGFGGPTGSGVSRREGRTNQQEAMGETDIPETAEDEPEAAKADEGVAQKTLGEMSEEEVDANLAGVEERVSEVRKDLGGVEPKDGGAEDRGDGKDVTLKTNGGKTNPTAVHPVTQKVDAPRYTLKELQRELAFYDDSHGPLGPEEEERKRRIEADIKDLQEVVEAAEEYDEYQSLRDEPETEARQEEEEFSELLAAAEADLPSVENGLEAHVQQVQSESTQRHFDGNETIEEARERRQSTQQSPDSIKDIDEARWVALEAQSQAEEALNTYGADSKQFREAQQTARAFRERAEELSTDEDWRFLAAETNSLRMELEDAGLPLDMEDIELFIEGNHPKQEELQARAPWGFDERVEAVREQIEILTVPEANWDDVTSDQTAELPVQSVASQKRKKTYSEHKRTEEAAEAAEAEDPPTPKRHLSYTIGETEYNVGDRVQWTSDGKDRFGGDAPEFPTIETIDVDPSVSPKPFARLSSGGFAPLSELTVLPEAAEAAAPEFKATRIGVKDGRYGGDVGYEYGGIFIKDVHAGLDGGEPDPDNHFRVIHPVDDTLDVVFRRLKDAKEFIKENPDFAAEKQAVPAPEDVVVEEIEKNLLDIHRGEIGEAFGKHGVLNIHFTSISPEAVQVLKDAGVGWEKIGGKEVEGYFDTAQLREFLESVEKEEATAPLSRDDEILRRHIRRDKNKIKRMRQRLERNEKKQIQDDIDIIEEKVAKGLVEDEAGARKQLEETKRDLAAKRKKEEAKIAELQQEVDRLEAIESATADQMLAEGVPPEHIIEKTPAVVDEEAEAAGEHSGEEYDTAHAAAQYHEAAAEARRPEDFGEPVQAAEPSAKAKARKAAGDEVRRVQAERRAEKLAAEKTIEEDLLRAAQSQAASEMTAIEMAYRELSPKLQDAVDRYARHLEAIAAGVPNGQRKLDLLARELSEFLEKPVSADNPQFLAIRLAEALGRKDFSGPVFSRAMEHLVAADPGSATSTGVVSTAFGPVQTKFREAEVVKETVVERTTTAVGESDIEGWTGKKLDPGDEVSIKFGGKTVTAVVLAAGRPDPDNDNRRTYTVEVEKQVVREVTKEPVAPPREVDVPALEGLLPLEELSSIHQRLVDENAYDPNFEPAVVDKILALSEEDQKAVADAILVKQELADLNWTYTLLEPLAEADDYTELAAGILKHGIEPANIQSDLFNAKELRDYIARLDKESEPEGRTSDEEVEGALAAAVYNMHRPEVGSLEDLQAMEDSEEKQELLRGYVMDLVSNRRATENPDVAKRLWKELQKVVGVDKESGRIKYKAAGRGAMDLGPFAVNYKENTATRKIAEMKREWPVADGGPLQASRPGKGIGVTKDISMKLTPAQQVMGKSYRELQDIAQEMGLRADGKTEVLRERVETSLWLRDPARGEAPAAEPAAAEEEADLKDTPVKDLTPAQRLGARMDLAREEEFNKTVKTLGDKLANEEITDEEYNEKYREAVHARKESAGSPQYSFRGMNDETVDILSDMAVFIMESKASFPGLLGSVEVPEVLRRINVYVELQDDLDTLNSAVKGDWADQIPEMAEGLESGDQRLLDEVEAYASIVAEGEEYSVRQKRSALRLLENIGTGEVPPIPELTGVQKALIADDLYAEIQDAKRKLELLDDQLEENPTAGRSIAKEKLKTSEIKNEKVRHCHILIKDGRFAGRATAEQAEANLAIQRSLHSEHSPGKLSAIKARVRVYNEDLERLNRELHDIEAFGPVPGTDDLGHVAIRLQIEEITKKRDAYQGILDSVAVAAKARELEAAEMTESMAGDLDKQIMAAEKFIDFLPPNASVMKAAQEDLRRLWKKRDSLTSQLSNRLDYLSGSGPQYSLRPEDIAKQKARWGYKKRGGSIPKSVKEDAEQLKKWVDEIEKYYTPGDATSWQKTLRAAQNRKDGQKDWEESIDERVRLATENNTMLDEVDMRLMLDRAADLTAKAIETGRPEDESAATDFISMTLGIGSAMATNLHFLRNRSPEERTQSALTQAFFLPPKKLRDKIKSLNTSGRPAAAKKLLDNWKHGSRGKTFSGLKEFLAARKWDMENDLDKIVQNPSDARRLLDDIGKYNSTGWDVLFEYWRNSILSGPATQIANMVGTGFFTAYEIGIKRNLMALANTFANDPDLPTFGEQAAVIRKLWATMCAEARHNAAESFGSEHHVLESQLFAAGLEVDPRLKRGTAMEGGELAIAGPEFKNLLTGKKTDLGRTVRLPQRGLLAVDEWMKTSITHAYAAGFAHRAANKQVREGKLKPEEKASMIEMLLDPSEMAEAIWMPAYKEALRQTWQTPFEEQGKVMGTIGQQLIKMREGIPLTRFLLPFIMTPLNIFKTGVEMSPLGMAGKALAWNKVRSDGVGIEGRVEELGSDLANAVLVGIPMMMMMAQDEEEPWITGTEQSVLQGRERYPSGREGSFPPFSVRLPFTDKWLSYSRIEPFATVMGFTVDIAKSLKSGRVEEWFVAPFKSYYEQIKDKTFLRGIGDLQRATETTLRGEPVNGFGNYLSSFAVSWIPNLLRAPARATQEVMPDRKIYGKDNKQKWNSLLSGTLKRTEVLPALGVIKDLPRVDMWGREFPRHRSLGVGGGLGDFLYKLLIPAQIRTTHQFVGDETMRNYNVANPDDEYNGPEAPHRYIEVNYKKNWLNPEQYEEYCRMAGGLAAELCRTLDLNVDNPSKIDIEKIKDAHERARKTTTEVMTRKWWGESGSDTAIIAETAEELRRDMIRAKARKLSERPPTIKRGLSKEERRLPYAQKKAILEDKRKRLEEEKQAAFEWLKSEGIGPREAANTYGTRPSLSRGRSQIRRSYRRAGQ